MENQTTVTEFILLGFSGDPHMQIFLFLVFLVIYLTTLGGNIVIMVVIRADSHLHNPMYFFLFHLSFVDICYSSVTRDIPYLSGEGMDMGGDRSCFNYFSSSDT
uniref:G-protein coupled receptors family 1 profile domain-containing protein n=1 Tax=Chelydra serpentina TaxID=8475 RepID=A0A8C3XM65_CHESE